MVAVKVEADISPVHQIVNTSNEEHVGLGADPFFTGDLDLIIVCKLPPVELCISSGPKTCNCMLSDQCFSASIRCAAALIMLGVIHESELLNVF